MNELILPETISPRKFAYENKRIGGLLPIAKLPHFDGLLTHTDGEVSVSMRFFMDTKGLAVLEGDIKTQLSFNCQRCLRPVSLDFSVNYALSPVTSDSEAENLPSAYEPVVVYEDEIELAEIVSAELLLQLPMYPIHEKGCQENVTERHTRKEETSAKQEETHKPFKDLKKLLSS